MRSYTAQCKQCHTIVEAADASARARQLNDTLSDLRIAGEVKEAEARLAKQAASQSIVAAEIASQKADGEEAEQAASAALLDATSEASSMRMRASLAEQTASQRARATLLMPLSPPCGAHIHCIATCLPPAA
jgi:hypothetical protein